MGALAINGKRRRAALLWHLRQSEDDDDDSDEDDEEADGDGDHDPDGDGRDDDDGIDEGRTKATHPTAPELPQEMIDAWLLREFPGRTLEELDRMDYLRFLRAVDARRMNQVEQKRSAWFREQEMKLSTRERRAIASHDKLLKEYFPDG